MPMPEIVALYLAFGCLAGVLSGMFGIGGGVVIVPFLVWQFGRQGMAPESVMVMAIATSLATIVATSLSAVYAHHRRGAVQWRVAARLSPGILAGTVLGSVVADRLPVAALKLTFAVFLLFVGLRMLVTVSGGERHPWRPHGWLMATAGLVIGAASAIVGIGGGTLSVPFLSRLRFPMRQAVATSSACGFPIALAGSASYAVLGWNVPSLPTGSVGYVYLPALAGIAVSSVAFAPLGARLAHWLPTGRLKKLFALVILAIGGRMLWLSLITWTGHVDP